MTGQEKGDLLIKVTA